MPCEVECHGGGVTHGSQTSLLTQQSERDSNLTNKTHWSAESYDYNAKSMKERQ